MWNLYGVGQHPLAEQLQEKAAAEGQANALAGPISYNITINGVSHSVAVEPA